MKSPRAFLCAVLAEGLLMAPIVLAESPVWDIEVPSPVSDVSPAPYAPDFGVMVSSKIPGENFFYLFDPRRTFSVIGVLREERKTFRTLRMLWCIPMEELDLALQVSLDSRGYPVELLWTDGSRLEVSVPRKPGRIRVTGFGADRKKRFTADYQAASELGPVTMFSPALPISSVLGTGDVSLDAARNVARGADRALDAVNAWIDAALSAAEDSGRTTPLWNRAFLGYAQDELGAVVNSAASRNYDVFRERYDFSSSRERAEGFFRDRTEGKFIAMQRATRADNSVVSFRISSVFSFEVDPAGSIWDVSQPAPQPTQTPSPRPREVLVPKLSGAVRLDGRAASSEWGQAVAISSPRDQTTYRLRRTEKHLHILVEQAAETVPSSEAFFYPLLFDMNGDHFVSSGSDAGFVSHLDPEGGPVGILKSRGDALGYFEEGDYALGNAGPTGAAVAGGFGATPAMSSPHQYFEVAIPLGELVVFAGGITAQFGMADAVTLVLK
jgi:hypothetical protein